MIGFLRQTRAGATTLVAATVAIMSVMGVALISDHLWLVSQRDLLKSASSAASLAVTIKLSELSGQTPTPSDADIQATLQPLAERYVRLNVLGNLKEALQPDDITVALAIDRGAGTVAVTTTAPLGSTLLDSIHGYPGSGAITVGSGAEQMQEAIWTVLAIDISRSMSDGLDGSYGAAPPNRRIDIVQAAAKDFIDVLGPDAAKNIAIGVVPWARGVYGVLAPSTDRAVIVGRIDWLNATGGATRSSAGLEEGRAQLANAPVGARKALVLLTDGEDNLISATQPCRGRQSLGCLQPRRDQCKAAKDAGIEIFTVAAMSPGHVSSTLGQELTACASSSAHAFLNNSDSTVLRGAFSKIAASLTPLRLTH